MRAIHHREIRAIMISLDKWFDEHALQSIMIDLAFHKGFVAICDGKIAGFITFFVYEAVGIIGWLGVGLRYQNKGTGSDLLRRLEDELVKNRIDTVQVYTLSDTVEYEPYEKTRAFYFRNGFTEYRRIATSNPNCPEELYLRKKLSSREGRE